MSDETLSILSDEIARPSEVLEVARLEDIFPIPREKYEMIFRSENTPTCEGILETMDRSETVMVSLNLHGLGDSVIEMRHAMLMARSFPEKGFVFVVPKGFLQISGWELPQNVRLCKEYDEDIMADPSSLLVCLNQAGSIHYEIRDAQKGLLSSYYKMLNERRVFCLADLLMTRSIYGYLQRIGCLPFASGVNYTDIFYAMSLDLLGAKNLSASHLDVPMLKPVVPEAENEFDIVIAPDAREYPDSVDGVSIKSLPLHVWSKLASHLPKDKKVCLVKGVCAPQYCEKVYEELMAKGIDATFRETPTLGDFVSLVRSGRRFVGMDSGTTHLASEAAKVSSFDIREIYSISEFSVEEYGIRGLGQRGLILPIYIHYLRDHNLGQDHINTVLSKLTEHISKGL